MEIKVLSHLFGLLILENTEHRTVILTNYSNKCQAPLTLRALFVFGQKAHLTLKTQPGWHSGWLLNIYCINF